MFTLSGAGFDAVVGNPPWEIQKPNSREFFSNIDPLYRTYGKQEALRQQKGYFRNNTGHEDGWLGERARLKSLSNWIKFTANPFGDRITTDRDGDRKFDCSLGRGFEASEDLHRRWARLRSGRAGYADAAHPYSHQGSADLNTYKMFLESSYRLLRDSGRLGMIVPAGIYSDQGSTGLRTLFLEQSRWEWLFSFENRDGIFEIHRSFKFNPLVVEKGGRTETIRTGFMHHKLQDWDEAEKHALDYPGDRVVQFSPASKAFLEIRSEQDRITLEKLYANGVLLGDKSERGWGITYATEFHMTNDSDLFAPRSDWEAKGYQADEYGHWLQGEWFPYEGPKDILERERDLVLSADGTKAIRVGDLDGVALSFYQGVMIGPNLIAASTHVSGSGSLARWAPLTSPDAPLTSQFLMSVASYMGSERRVPGLRVIHRAQARTTDTRTLISCLVKDLPFGHSLSSIQVERGRLIPQCLAAGLFSSLAYEWLLRSRIAGPNVGAFHVFESAWPRPQNVPKSVALLAARLNLTQKRDSDLWLQLARDFVFLKVRGVGILKAITNAERLRIRCVNDAVAARLFGLDIPDFAAILADCDHSEARLAEKSFRSKLNPKGYWRVDRNSPPHVRHTVLSLIAFQELERIGLNAFLDLNDGEGWMLPETLRLADYGLGHDDRAQEHQAVASVLGPRFYDWQLSQSVEESWEECERHAELLAKIVPPPDRREEEAPESAADHSPDEPQVNLFGEPLPADLFGNPEHPRRRR